MSRSLGLFILAMFVIHLGASNALGDELRRFKSKSYDITTDLPDSLAREVASHMDAVHAEYTRRFRAYAKRNNEPLRLWVFAEQDGYQRFLAEHEINSIGSAGMFFRKGDTRGLAAYFAPRDMDSMLETLRHEGMHQFLYQRIGDNLPPWLNEGMAESFGYALETERGFEMGLADISAINRLQRHTEDGTLVSIETLLSLTQGEWNERNQNNQHEGQYDAAWSLVHFIAYAENGKYTLLLDEMLKLLWQGTDIQRATEQVFGTNLSLLDSKWKSYVAQLEPDELFRGRDIIAAHAVVIWELRRHGINPKNQTEFDRALRDHGESLELPESISTLDGDRPLTLDPDAWWRSLPKSTKNGRQSTMRFIPDRKDQQPVRLEIRGLKRTVLLEWNIGDDGLPKPRVFFK